LVKYLHRKGTTEDRQVPLKLQKPLTKSTSWNKQENQYFTNSQPTAQFQSTGCW